MSQENVEIVRRWVDAYNRRDWTATQRLYTPNAEIDWSRSRGPLRGVYRGQEGIEAFANEFFSIFEAIRLEVHDYAAGGSDVVVPNTAHLQGRDGIEVIARSAFVFTIEKGLIRRLRMFQERQEALEAAGLSE
jgi:ketosteroid isomerase-like protein